MKIGIALAGGGAKGAAHLGVIQALEENGIKASMYSGTSAGSIVAAAKAMGYGNKTILKMLDEISNDFIDVNYWGILKSLPHKLKTLEALLKGKELKKFLANNFDNYIKDVRYPLSIVSSDLYTGAQIIFSSESIPVAHEMDDIISVYTKSCDIKVKDIIYSSAAIPGVFPPHLYDDRKLVDGSVVNVIPANVLSAMGADKVIAINLGTQNRNKTVNGMLGVISRSVTMMINQNADLSLEYANNHILLSPDVSAIGLLDFDKAREAYLIGYQYGNKIAKQVDEFIYGDA